MSDLDIQENINLAPYTTMKIGGRARFFVRAESENDVIEALKFAAERSVDVFVLGGGSNVLISDRGFEGLVLQIGILSSKFQVPSSELGVVLNSKLGTVNSKLVTAGAGEDWDGFVAFCVERDLAGLECLSGIPGFVGGTPVQNVGAYGQEVAESIVSVRCLDRQSLEIVELSSEECGFLYRKSIFNSTAVGRFIVLSVTFSLVENGEPKIAYKDIRECFADRKPTLAEVREAVLTIRRAKSMVIDPDDPNSRSAGSFFRNPVVSNDEFAKIRESFPGAPGFVVDEQNMKVPAAWLIENSGFHKGFALGKAGISSKHTLAIINRGGASSGEIVALKDYIQATVEQHFGINLQPEPIFVGF